MRFQVRLEQKAQKQLERLPEVYRLKVLALLPAIAEDPYIGKKLKGKLKGSYSYRAWPYRITYKVYKRILVVVIVKVEHRQGIYK